MRVAIAAVSGSLSIIVTTLDAVLDVISGFIIWSTSVAKRARNKYKFPIGQVGDPKSLWLFPAESSGLPGCQGRLLLSGHAFASCGTPFECQLCCVHPCDADTSPTGHSPQRLKHFFAACSGEDGAAGHRGVLLHHGHSRLQRHFGGAPSPPCCATQLHNGCLPAIASLGSMCCFPAPESGVTLRMQAMRQLVNGSHTHLPHAWVVICERTFTVAQTNIIMAVWSIRCWTDAESIE